MQIWDFFPSQQGGEQHNLHEEILRIVSQRDRIGQDASLWYNEDESKRAGPTPLHTLHDTLTDDLPDRAARFERLCESRWPFSPFTCWDRCK